MASVPGDEASVAAAVARHPDRFCGYFMVNPTQRFAGDASRGRALERRTAGHCLFPAMHHYSVQDTRLMPLYEIAAAHPGTVVFVHCGALSVGVRKKLGLPSHFDMRFSNPLDLHAIAMQFPKLNFIVPHFGAGLFREALMLCDLCPNVYLDTSSSNSWMKYEGLDLKTVFQRARESAAPDRLLFGTDSSFFPRGWNAEDLRTADQRRSPSWGSAAEAPARYFGGNLERLSGAVREQTQGQATCLSGLPSDNPRPL